jgi:hypothetical protein
LGRVTVEDKGITGRKACTRRNFSNILVQGRCPCKDAAEIFFFLQQSRSAENGRTSYGTKEPAREMKHPLMQVKNPLQI